MKNVKFFLFGNLLHKEYISGGLKKSRPVYVIIKIMGILLAFFLISGCRCYYKVITTRTPESEVFSPLADMRKDFVVHSGKRTFNVKNITLINDSIQGNYIEDYKLPFKNDRFPKNDSSNRYRKKKGEKRLLNEIHLYIRPVLSSSDNKISFAVKDIFRLDVYNPDKTRTAVSWFLGVTAAILVLPVTGFLMYIIPGGFG